MDSNRKVFATTLVCFLAMSVMSNALGMDLSELDKGDGKPNEAPKVASPSHISSPTANHAPTDQGHSSLPQADQSPPKSLNSDHANPITPPDNSTQLVLPPGPEGSRQDAPKKVEENSPQNVPNKEETKSLESPKKEDNTTLQSPEKGDDKALQTPVLVDKIPQAPKEDKVQEHDEGASKSGNHDENSDRNEICETKSTSTLACRAGELVACLLQPEAESTELFLLVQNYGEDDLNINITSFGNTKFDFTPLNLLKKSNKKMKLKSYTSAGLKVVLNAGKGDCVLQTKIPASFDWPSFQHIPAYAAQVRPLHGAYFFSAVIIIIGGTWAFCKFGKKEKRADAGIPYQQLEMGAQTQPTSVPMHVNNADSWDQNWDDDWDDEEALKTSTKHAENVSSNNGLSSRPPANPNQNGWEIDWDD